MLYHVHYQVVYVNERTREHSIGLVFDCNVRFVTMFCAVPRRGSSLKETAMDD